MAEVKTKLNDGSVTDFLNKIADKKKREDSYKIIDLMKKVTKYEPKMWGTSIVGFGSYHYKYESGREGDICLVGFSPRKQNLTLYIMSDFSKYDELLKKLGKYKTSKACLYIKKIEDIDIKILEEIIAESVKMMSKKI